MLRVVWSRPVFTFSIAYCFVLHKLNLSRSHSHVIYLSYNVTTGNNYFCPVLCFMLIFVLLFYKVSMLDFLDFPDFYGVV